MNRRINVKGPEIDKYFNMRKPDQTAAAVTKAVRPHGGGDLHFTLRLGDKCVTCKLRARARAFQMQLERVLVWMRGDGPMPKDLSVIET